MSSCCAFGCSSRFKARSGVTFHRLPLSRPEMLKKWMVNIRREKWTPMKATKICSKHFEEKDFDRTGQTVRLRVGAIPTIFNFPPHLQKKVRQRNPQKLRREPADEVHESSCATENRLRGKAAKVEVIPKRVTSAIASPVKVVLVCPAPTRSIPVQTETETAPLETSEDICARSTNDEHHYFASPLTLKRLLDEEKIKNAEMHKRLKTEQQARRRLQTKVNSFRQVVDALKKEQLISDFAIAVLEKTFSGEPLSWETIVSHH